MKSINGGGTNPEYTYNAEGRRVRKKAGGTTTEYVYDLGGSVVAEFVGTTWTKGYVYIGGQLLAQYDNTVTPATTYFVHKDHLGSTRLLSKLDKSPLESPYDYLPYGEPMGSSGSGTTHKFTGKERDAESGLDFFGARYYASTTGRYGAADLPFIDQHLPNPQSWSLYAYARNNPLKFVDPTGNSATDPKGGFPKMEGGDGTDLGFDPISAFSGIEGGEEAEGANSHALRILAYAEAGGNPLVVAAALQVHNQVYNNPGQQIAAMASRYAGATRWLSTRKGGIDINRCNQFVADMIEMAGLPRPQVPYENVGGGWLDLAKSKLTRDPSANEWANPNVNIPGWSAPMPLSQGQVGDVIAQAHGRFGHVGIIVSTTPNLTASANTASRPAGIVTRNDWGFRPYGQNGERRGDLAPVVRRFVGGTP